MDIPGVIKGVPFSRVGIATVSCVVTAHRCAWVIGHCIQVVDCIYCKGTETKTLTESTSSKDFLKFNLIELYFKCKTWFGLTAVFRCKLPKVEILQGEVNKCGQFAGSPRFREAFQVWTAGGVKEQVLFMCSWSFIIKHISMGDDTASDWSSVWCEWVCVCSRWVLVNLTLSLSQHGFYDIKVATMIKSDCERGSMVYTVHCTATDADVTWQFHSLLGNHVIRQYHTYLWGLLFYYHTMENNVLLRWTYILYDVWCSLFIFLLKCCMWYYL